MSLSSKVRDWLRDYVQFRPEKWEEIKTVVETDDDQEHKAYSVTYTNAPACQGRQHAADYRQVTAIVIGVDVVHAVATAELYFAKHFIGLHLEEVRLEDDLVIE